MSSLALYSFVSSGLSLSVCFVLSDRFSKQIYYGWWIKVIVIFKAILFIYLFYSIFPLCMWNMYVCFSCRLYQYFLVRCLFPAAHLFFFLSCVSIFPCLLSHFFSQASFYCPSASPPCRMSSHFTISLSHLYFAKRTFSVVRGSCRLVPCRFLFACLFISLYLDHVLKKCFHETVFSSISAWLGLSTTAVSET